MNNRGFRIRLACGLVGVIAVLGFAKFRLVSRHIEEGKKKGPPPTTVSTVTVAQEDWQKSLHAFGSLRAERGTTLSTQEAGIVTAILVEPGAEVKEGTILASLDTTVEQAELAAAEARSWEAKKALDRANFLAPRNASSRSELDQAEAASRSSEATAGALKARIQRKILRAPFTGKTGIKLVEIGSYVSPGTPILPLYQIDSLLVDFSLPQQSIGNVQVGQSMELTVDGIGTFPGAVTAVDPQVDISTRNFLIQASLNNEKRKLHPGMFGMIELHTGQKTAVFPIPQSAISYAPYGDSVYVVQESATEGAPTYTVIQRFVQVGESRGEQVGVVSGLKAGDRVVSSGAFRLRPGLPILVDDSRQPGNDPAAAPADS
jgi:membrane fusion protein (multidrug efflux system)